MVENEFVRIEVGLEGGTILSALVVLESAEALERALNAGMGGTLPLETQDGSVLLVVTRVLYAKRFARDGRVGFGG